MANNKVTMQDIADACGLSRNTVSKVFNGRGSVPQNTRNIILKKAEELGYKAIPNENAFKQSSSGKVIALLTNKLPSEYHFGRTHIYRPHLSCRIYIKNVRDLS